MPKDIKKLTKTSLLSALKFENVADNKRHVLSEISTWGGELFGPKGGRGLFEPLSNDDG